MKKLILGLTSGLVAIPAALATYTESTGTASFVAVLANQNPPKEAVTIFGLNPLVAGVIAVVGVYVIFNWKKLFK